MYKLVCGKDARKEGIEDKEGNWNISRLREHVLKCPDCREFAGVVMRLLVEALRERGGFHVTNR